MYGTIAAVKQITGFKAADFHVTAEEFDALLTARLVDATGLINGLKYRDYEADVAAIPPLLDALPPLIHTIAEKIVANMLTVAIAQRVTPVIRVNDFTVRLTDDRVITPEIKLWLSVLPNASSGSRRRPFSLYRNPGRDEEYDATTGTWELP